jgi:hypothetical protein
MKRRTNGTTTPPAVAFLCEAILAFAGGCEGSEKVDISTSRGDPAPLEVTLTYREEFTDIGGEHDGEKRLLWVRAVFSNIESFEYLTGGPLSLVGDEVEKSLGSGATPIGKMMAVRRTIEIDDPDLIDSVEIWGAVGAFEQDGRPRSDGLYEAPADADSTFFLCFFDDWKVRMVLSSGSTRDVATWIAKTENAYEGGYGVRGSIIQFALSASEGRVRYEGQLTEQGLSTVSGGLPREFRFREIEIDR